MAVGVLHEVLRHEESVSFKPTHDDDDESAALRNIGPPWIKNQSTRRHGDGDGVVTTQKVLVLVYV